MSTEVVLEPPADHELHERVLVELPRWVGRDHPTVGPLIDAFVSPLGRNGRPAEIAALLQYLLGPDARFFCGSVIFCDGGMDAQLRADEWPRPWRP